jgi:hypothetical protein
MDLADPARAAALMPTLLEAELVDVEPECALHVSNEEHGTRVPPVTDFLSDGYLGHIGSSFVQLVIQPPTYHNQPYEVRSMTPNPAKPKNVCNLCRLKHLFEATVSWEV